MRIRSLGAQAAVMRAAGGGTAGALRCVAMPRTTCNHCRAPLEEGAADYCCRGCEAAHDLLVGAGLGRYYELQTGTGTPGDATPSELPWLPALIEGARLGAKDPTRVTLTLDVQGLHCAGCVWLFQALFRKQPGGHHLEVNPGQGRLKATFDPSRFDFAAWLSELARVGYRAGPPSDREAQSDGLGLRLGISFAITMNAMGLALAGYFGLEPDDPAGLSTLFDWVNLALSTLALCVAGPVFLRGAWHALRARSLHLDVPIALGVLLAWAGSLALFAAGRPDLAYFDTLDIFLTLMLLGRWAQRRLLDRSRRLLLEDDGFAMTRVRIVEDGFVTARPLSEIRAGARILVAPGEIMPVAADLATPEPCDFDLAWLTGEPEPITFTTQPVPAGAHLVGPARVVIAREAFATSALHALLARTSSTTRAAGALPSRDDDRFWHYLTTGWVVIVLAFAAITAIAWWLVDPALALRHATAVLVVTCPCAIGLATPLAYELAHHRLRRMALLPRRPGLLDRARNIRHVIFDKTGTLTMTELSLANPEALDALAPADRHLLWQLTARSNHPKSRALNAALPSSRLDESIVVSEVPGRGLIADDHALVGHERTLRFDHGATTLATFTFRESLRPAARSEVARLAAAGVTVHIASGDAPAAVYAIADALGIPRGQAHAFLSPADKVALVERLGPGRTMMIGDGINDVLAFERAAIAGTPAIDRPVLPARADFVLLGSGLGAIAELITLGRATRRTTLRNLVIASIYNVLGLAAGLAGWLSPVVAAVAMPASSLIVIALTLYAARGAARPSPSSPSAGDPSWMPST